MFDASKQTSIGFEKCLHLGSHHAKLTKEEAGLLRAVDAFRDAEQHWMIVMPEDVLFLHARAFVTTFDDLLKRSLADTLADHLPGRVLPISTNPPVAFDILVDREYAQIRSLFAPGKRHRDEARGRIRALLAMESHVVEGVDMSEADIDRIEKAVRSGKSRAEVFPRLDGLTTTVSGEGATVVVRFTKGDGAPITLVPADDPSDAAAVREVDLQKKFHLSATKLAEVLGVKPHASYALRVKLGIDGDPKCRHVFTFGKSKHPMFSDNAMVRMRDALKIQAPAASAPSPLKKAAPS